MNTYVLSLWSSNTCILCEVMATLYRLSQHNCSWSNTIPQNYFHNNRVNFLPKESCWGPLHKVFHADKLYFLNIQNNVQPGYLHTNRIKHSQGQEMFILITFLGGECSKVMIIITYNNMKNYVHIMTFKLFK